MTIFSDMARDYGGRGRSNKTRVKTVGAGLQTRAANHNAFNIVRRIIKIFIHVAASEECVYVTMSVHSPALGERGQPEGFAVVHTETPQGTGAAFNVPRRQ